MGELGLYDNGSVKAANLKYLFSNLTHVCIYFFSAIYVRSMTSV